MQAITSFSRRAATAPLLAIALAAASAAQAQGTVPSAATSSVRVRISARWPSTTMVTD